MTHITSCLPYTPSVQFISNPQLQQDLMLQHRLRYMNTHERTHTYHSIPLSASPSPQPILPDPFSARHPCGLLQECPSLHTYVFGGVSLEVYAYTALCPWSMHVRASAREVLHIWSYARFCIFDACANSTIAVSTTHRLHHTYTYTHTYYHTKLVKFVMDLCVLNVFCR